MGGATAQLITMQLLRGQECHLLPPDVSVRCVALGSPPVFRPELDLSQDIVNMINIYVNSKDVVPRLSLGSVANLMAMVREVDRLGLTLEEQVGVVMGWQGKTVEKNRLRVVEVVKSIKQEQYPYLEHPGQVMMLTRGGEGVEVSRIMVERMVTSIEIDEMMITDHLYTKYQEVFSKDIV